MWFCTILFLCGPNASQNLKVLLKIVWSDDYKTVIKNGLTLKIDVIY
jgi:hypothetical protein